MLWEDMSPREACTSSSSREILLLISVSEGPFAPEDRVEPGKLQDEP